MLTRGCWCSDRSSRSSDTKVLRLSIAALVLAPCSIGFRLTCSSAREVASRPRIALTSAADAPSMSMDACVARDFGTEGGMLLPVLMGADDCAPTADAMLLRFDHTVRGGAKRRMQCNYNTVRMSELRKHRVPASYAFENESHSVRLTSLHRERTPPAVATHEVVGSLHGADSYRPRMLHTLAQWQRGGTFCCCRCVRMRVAALPLCCLRSRSLSPASALLPFPHCSPLSACVVRAWLLC